MENESPELPPDGQKALTVGIIYNLKSKENHKVEDEEAEYDSIETVLAISEALKTQGHTVILMEDNGHLPEKLAQTNADIVFNIAEGRGGRGREAQAPCLLGYYGIPYTGSDETALCIALDKELTKRIVSAAGVRTPKAVLVRTDKTYPEQLSGLHYPLIVKPNAEGSGKGISDVSVVQNEAELTALLSRNFRLYHSDMLVEEFIDGGEYTVGLLGNGETLSVFSPMEIRYRRHTQGDFDVYSYRVKCDYTSYVDYLCPAPLSPETEAEMRRFALLSFEALGCRDFARVDFRTDRNGKVYFIEINPLPGLAPSYSDYPMLAQFCGTSYNDLVVSVFNAARKRTGV